MTTDKSQVDIIPDEVMEKINEVFDGTNMGKHKIEAAKFGYSLGIAGRSKTHDEKEQRVKELEDKLEAAKLALKEIAAGTDFPLSISQNALRILSNK